MGQKYFVPIDLLDAAIVNALGNMGITFGHVPLTSASFEYRLHKGFLGELGDLGSLRVRALNLHESELVVIAPRRITIPAEESLVVEHPWLLRKEEEQEEIVNDLCDRLRDEPAIRNDLSLVGGIDAQPRAIGATADPTPAQWSSVMRKSWQLPPEEPDMVGKPGSPGLPHPELIYRLAKAQEGEEIKEREPQKTWKQIAHEIQWRYGNDAKGIKLLEDARKKLKRANQGTIKEIQEWKEKRKKR